MGILCNYKLYMISIDIYLNTQHYDEANEHILITWPQVGLLTFRTNTTWSLRLEGQMPPQGWIHGSVAELIQWLYSMIHKISIIIKIIDSIGIFKNGIRPQFFKKWSDLTWLEQCRPPHHTESSCPVRCCWFLPWSGEPGVDTPWHTEPNSPVIQCLIEDHSTPTGAVECWPATSHHRSQVIHIRPTAFDCDHREVVFHDSPWFAMIFYDFLWFFHDFPWFFMIFHDFLWFSMVSLLDLSSSVSARHPERSMSSELSWAVTRFPNWRPGNVSPCLVINPQLLICLIQPEQQNTEPEVFFKTIWIYDLICMSLSIFWPNCWFGIMWHGSQHCSNVFNQLRQIPSSRCSRCLLRFGFALGGPWRLGRGGRCRRSGRIGSKEPGSLWRAVATLTFQCHCDAIAHRTCLCVNHRTIGLKWNLTKKLKEHDLLTKKTSKRCTEFWGSILKDSCKGALELSPSISKSLPSSSPKVTNSRRAFGTK